MSRDVGTKEFPHSEVTKWRGYTWVQLQRCAERELGWRKRVYPNRVLTHRMSADKAAQEVDMMRVIAEHLAELAEGEKLL